MDGHILSTVKKQTNKKMYSDLSHLLLLIISSNNKSWMPASGSPGTFAVVPSSAVKPFRKYPEEHGLDDSKSSQVDKEC